MSEIPKCENCDSTNIEYWEKKKSWFSVVETDGKKIRIGKTIDDDDIYDNGFMCTDCLEEQPELDKYEKEFLL